MGVLENLTGLLSGSATRTESVEFDLGEVEVARTTACTLKFGGKSWVGGELVLSSKRLLFTPLNMKDLAGLLGYGLQKSGVKGAQLAVGWIAKQIRQEATGLATIASARPGRSGDWLRPPSIVLVTTDGREIEFGVLAGRLLPNWSAAHRGARDEFLVTLEASLPKAS